MAHPATATGTTFRVNGRNVTKTAVPVHRPRLVAGSPEEVVRTFNQHVDDVLKATQDARSLPFGGPKVIVEAVAFTNATDTRVAHNLATDRVFILAGVATFPSAGLPYLAVKSIDASFVTFHAYGTFTADVVFMVKP